VTAGRWELLRALGAVAGDPADARKVLAALGLEPGDGASHTEVFVLNCPPYASVYLGAEGGLGGEGGDRVAGFWRAIGLTPPAEPDHLTSLFSLYAALGEAGQARQARQARQAEDRSAVSGVIATETAERSSCHARRALFWEHLWPWLPGYLGAVTDVGVPALGAWADLTRQALTAERAGQSPDALPLALREAPPPLTGDEGLDELLDALVTPVRSGMILTRRALADGAGQAGAGHRIGERRFTLRAMLEQEPERTLRWLADEAEHWSARHSASALDDPAHQWWAARAFATATILRASVAVTP
jgi:TorA maturation chaperone TorD